MCVCVPRRGPRRRDVAVATTSPRRYYATGPCPHAGATSWFVVNGLSTQTSTQTPSFISNRQLSKSPRHKCQPAPQPSSGASALACQERNLATKTAAARTPRTALRKPSLKIFAERAAGPGRAPERSGGARPGPAAGGAPLHRVVGARERGENPAALARAGRPSGGAARRSGAHTCPLARHQLRCGRN